MRVFEDPALGVMLVAPTPLLRSLLLRIISLRSASSPTPKEASAHGEGPETPEIVSKPLITETIEWPVGGVAMNCKHCGGLEYPDKDLGMVCRTCGRSRITRLSTPDLEADARSCKRAFKALDGLADHDPRPNRWHKW